MDWNRELDRIVEEAELESMYGQVSEIEPELDFQLKRIAEHYGEGANPYRAGCEETARSLLIRILSDERLKEIHSAKYRVKTAESLIGKCIRKKAELPRLPGEDWDVEKYRPLCGDNYYKVITDLVGIRILIRYPQQWRMVHEWILDVFALWKQDCVKDWEAAYPEEGAGNFLAEQPRLYVRYGNEISAYLVDGELPFRPTISKEGYCSLHYLVWYEGHYAEIQVRTIFDEAWGECTHDLVYNRHRNSGNRQELERLSVCLAAQTQSAGMLASLMYDMAFPGEDREEPAADGYLAGRIFKGPAL